MAIPREILKTLEGKKAPTSLDGLARVIFGFVEPMVDELKALRQRVTDLEGHGIKYCGVHQRAMQYKRGDVVTFHGSGWVAVKETQQSPEDGPDWQLLVKKGRDS